MSIGIKILIFQRTFFIFLDRGGGVILNIKNRSSIPFFDPHDNSSNL